MRCVKTISFMSIAALLLIGSGYFLGRSLLLYQTLKTHSADLTVSTSDDGKIVIAGCVDMRGDTWKYFRGIPHIEVHGVDFPRFFSTGGELSFELRQPGEVRKISIAEEEIRKQEHGLCGKSSTGNNGAAYRIYPSVTVHKDIRGGKWVDVSKSYTLNYREGINMVTLTLDHFSEDKSAISGEIIFDALENRVHCFFPLPAALLCIALASAILVVTWRKSKKTVIGGSLL